MLGMGPGIPLSIGPHVLARSHIMLRCWTKVWEEWNLQKAEL